MCPERKIQLLARQNSISVKVAVERAREWRFRPKAGFPQANFFARSDGSLFPLSASILPRLANVISDTDKGKRSLRARKFARGNRLNKTRSASERLQKRQSGDREQLFAK